MDPSTSSLAKRKSLKCNICGKEFDQNVIYDQFPETLSHFLSCFDKNGEKQKCEICDNVFNTKSSLQKHIVAFHSSSIDGFENQDNKSEINEYENNESEDIESENNESKNNEDILLENNESEDNESENNESKNNEDILLENNESEDNEY